VIFTQSASAVLAGALDAGLLFAIRLPRLRVSARALLAAHEHVGGQPPEAATPAASLASSGGLR
jgi:hypothetical protein